jgi:multicomponent Na+:H+ antiporter subunit G
MQADSAVLAAKLLLVWGLALIASATACWLVADSARRNAVPPWTGQTRCSDGRRV